MNQDALAVPDLRGAMEHLVRRDVVQDQADSPGGLQASRYRDQFTFRQADKLGIYSVNRQGSDCPPRQASSYTLPQALRDANQIPTRSEGDRGCFGVNTLTRHYVGQGDTCRQHSDPHFTPLRLAALVFNNL